MRKRLTITISSIFGLFVATTLFFITGCSKNNTENSQKIIYESDNKEIEANLTVPFEKLDLIVGDEYYINPSYNKIKDYSFTYNASNTNVSVNEYGIIKAEKNGSCEVSVIYSNSIKEYVKTFTVNVSFGNYVPTIKTNVDDKLVLEQGDQFDLNPSVMFRNVSYDDARFSYESLDENIATISKDGIVSATNKGNAKILVNASWKGKNKTSFPSLSTCIDIEVIDSVRFLNGSDIMQDITLYTASSANEQKYNTTLDFDFKVIINNEVKQADYQIIDNSFVEVDNNQIKAISAGVTNIELYKEIDGNRYSSIYWLNVIRPIVDIEQTVPMFSILDGMYYDSATNTKKDLKSFVNEQDDIIGARQGAFDLEVVDNKVLNVNSPSNLKRANTSIRIYTNKLEYNLNLETITKVISNKEDLKCFEIKDADISGYYELANNIDSSGITINQTNSRNYFTGIFNGCGYSISNLDISNSSLFGSLYTSAKLTNFALRNLKASNTNYFANKNSSDSITVSNVYIELSQDTINPQGMFITSPSHNTISNVVIVYLGDNANTIPDYSLGGWTNQSLLTSNQYYAFDDTLHTQTANWSDVICISPYALGFRPYEKVLKLEDDTTDYATYYFGVNETKDFYNNDIVDIENTRPIESINCVSETYFDVVYKEVYHFKSLSELKNYNYDYSSFTSQYWVINDGIITWKN